jgi:Cu2+-exporting ATPase
MTDDLTLIDDPAELDLVSRPVDGHAGVREAWLAIDGLHCAACSVTIESALSPLVRSIEVNVLAGRARLVWEPGRVALSDLLRRLVAMDYHPRPVPLDAVAAIDVRGRRRALWRAMVATLCAMQVMMFAVPRYVAGDAMPADLQALMTWAELLLTVPVLVFAAGPFFSGAVADLRHGRIGMDVPVALGILVSVLASLPAMARGEAVWFDSVTMFVCLLVAARWLESAARERATAGLASSLARLPEAAERIDDAGRATSVSRHALRPGDRLRVPAGATVAADGTLVAGTATFDESLLTGESRPVAKGPGDAIVAGSLNLDQPVEILVTRAAAQSRLAELQTLVERASATRPAVLRMADRIARPFLLAIVLVAAATAAAWSMVDPDRALWVAASVLIVTCPCAIALAAPAALIAALGGLARRGIAVTSTATLEALARSDLVILDKTGTLTTREPVLAIDSVDGIDAGLALALGAAVEKASLHPIARAFARAAGVDDGAVADGQRLRLEQVAERPGGGLVATVLVDGTPTEVTIVPDGEQIRLDARSVASASGSASGSATASASANVAAATARFSIVEALRPDAAATLAALRDDGLDCRIASGDHPTRVDRVAGALGLSPDRVEGGLTPERKLDRLHREQADGRVVIMVGDGINDAPVLGRADVSVSFASAAPLARHEADVLLLDDRLESLHVARATARHAMRIVHQNLALSLVYNLVAIPLAVTGLLTPWQAGIGMAASSLAVVANALRASRTRPKPASSRRRQTPESTGSAWTSSTP